LKDCYFWVNECILKYTSFKDINPKIDFSLIIFGGFFYKLKIIFSQDSQSLSNLRMPQIPSILLIILLFVLLPLHANSQECTITTDNNGIITDNCPALHNCIDNTCIHKDIFPLTFREIFGGFLIMILSGLSTTGGMGGGSVLTPLLLTLYGYTANKSITLVYVLIFGGSLGNYLNVAFQRDIQTGKPLVIYDLALIMAPLMMLGSNIGVLLNKMIAPALIISGLLYLVITSLKKIYQKAKISYAKETQMLNKPLVNSPEKAKENIELFSFNNIPIEPEVKEKLPQELETILKEEKTFFPKSRLKFLGCLVSFILLVVILKGTDKFHSVLGIEYCSVTYWGWFVMGLIGCYCFYIKGLSIIEKKIELKFKYNFKQRDFRIGDDNIKQIERLAIIAGLLGALLGIGGGMILGNPMLAMGVGAQNMTATCGLFIVLTSFINLVQAFLMGSITMNEIIFFFIVSSVGSYSVSWGLTWLVKKYKRPSILLYSLTLIMAITLGILPLFTLYKTYLNPGQMLHFNPPC